MTRIIFVALALAVGLTSARADDCDDRLPDNRTAKGTKNITEVWFANPTTRYRHFVLDSQYEAGALYARLRDGRVVHLTLPETSVFENRQPRLADRAGDGGDRIVVVHTQLDRGASLAVVDVVSDALRFIAETPTTGSVRTWLNIAGIADFYGDGHLSVAYVQMPHVLVRLRLGNFKNNKLIERGTLAGATNHVAGTPNLGLAVFADFDGDGVAARPSLDRTSLSIISFRGGIREIGRKPLYSPATTDFRLEYVAGKPVVVVGLGGGRTQRVLF